MNFFGIHFCQDEAYAILMGIAFVGPLSVWARARYTALKAWMASKRAQ